MALNPDHFRAYKLMGGWWGGCLLHCCERWAAHPMPLAPPAAHPPLPPPTLPHPGSALYALGDFEGAKAALKESLK